MRYIVFICVSLYGSCSAMENAWDKFTQVISEPFVTFAAWVKHEDNLLKKSDISPLSHMPKDSIVYIAQQLDGKSIAHFAVCCKPVNTALNSSHVPFMHWHQNGIRAPLKIIKEYVVYNCALLCKCIESAPEEIQIGTLDTYFSSELADPNYVTFAKTHTESFHWDMQEPLLNYKQHAAKFYALQATRPNFKAYPMLTLVCASINDSEPPVRYLLKQKADPHFSFDDSSIETFDPINGVMQGFINNPVYKGNIQRCTDIINTLLEYNTDIHRIDPSRWDQWNYIHYAIVNGAYDLLPYLLGKGIDPNAQTSHMGCTPITLLMAVETKEELCDAMRLLLDAKADPHIKDNEGKTILDYIPETWHPDVQALIDKKA